MAAEDAAYRRGVGSIALRRCRRGKASQGARLYRLPTLVDIRGSEVPEVSEASAGPIGWQGARGVKAVAPNAGLPVTARSYGPCMTAQLIVPVPGSHLASQSLAATACTSQSWASPLVFPCGPCPPKEHIRQVARCLRTLERECSGMRRERWGYAAANAEATAAAEHPWILRLLWATARDYAWRAAESSDHVPVHPMRWSSCTPG